MVNTYFGNNPQCTQIRNGCHFQLGLHDEPLDSHIKTRFWHSSANEEIWKQLRDVSRQYHHHHQVGIHCETLSLVYQQESTLFHSVSPS